MIWHYAVKKVSYYFAPACVSSRNELDFGQLHGITINRGHVNCPDCLRAMGIE